MDDAKKDLAKLDKPVARRITGYLRERSAYRGARGQGEMPDVVRLG